MDREKVIKALEYCVLTDDCRTCDYWLEFDGTGCKVMKDALELLKEQEAVEPIRDATCVRMFRCGACGAYVGFVDSDLGVPNEQDNYCRNCGRSVKWE